MAFSAGDVVLVPFPFRDRLAESARPGVVVSCANYNQSNDLVIAAITSHGSRAGWDLTLQDWQSAGLKVPSTVRMLLATVAASRILLHLGSLSARDWDDVQRQVEKVFTWP